jgi:hypothetical protein
MSEAEQPTDGFGRTTRTGLRGSGIHLAALLVFAVATAITYGELWQRGADREVVYKAWVERGEDGPGFRAEALATLPDPAAWARASRADVIYESWLVSRNARTLVTRPQDLFDTEQCAPAEKTLTLGIPMITMGALAIPAWLATGDPILTYNWAVVALHAVAAFAMYWLVSSWTGVPVAGIIAGLLYAFHPIRLGFVMHPSVWDSAWTVLALGFAERLFARGRWRDAFGLVAAIAAQIGASFYSLLAAVFLTPAFGVWLVLRDRLRAVSVAQLAFVVAGAAAAAAALLGPYLWAPASGELDNPALSFAELSAYAPGGRSFPGWCLLGLAAIGALWPGGRWLRIAGDPRPALLVGTLLVALVAAGPTLPEEAARALPGFLAGLVPDLWAAFSAVLPGLDAVRIVARLLQGVLLALCILAGLGAALLIQRSGRLAELVAAVLLLFAAADTLRIESLGLEPRYDFEYTDIRPQPEDVEFFDALERRGNTGPILELPVLVGANVVAAPERIFLSILHGRRTSTCFGSYLPPDLEELGDLAERLPQRAAVARLVEQGFTTVVFHHPGRPDPLRGKRLPRERIRRIASRDGKTAYAVFAQ